MTETAPPGQVAAFARLRPHGGVRHLTGPASDSAYRIDKVFVSEGDTVTAGQPLLELDVKTVRAANRALVAAGVREAQIEVDFAQIELDRKLALKSSSSASVSASDVDTARRTLELAEARLHTAELQLNHDEILLDQATVRAPSAGLVMDILKQAGEGATAGEPLVELGDITNMEALAEVFETRARFVATGQSAVFSSPALHAPVPGRVLRIVPKVEETSIYSTNAVQNLEKRVVQVVIALDGIPADRVISGLQGTVVIETTTDGVVADADR